MEHCSTWRMYAPTRLSPRSAALTDATLNDVTAYQRPKRRGAGFAAPRTDHDRSGRGTGDAANLALSSALRDSRVRTARALVREHRRGRSARLVLSQVLPRE